jgi:hypothetical protein
MAKKTVTESELRRMRAARQERVGGKFGGLKPEFKRSGGTATLESVMQPTAAPQTPATPQKVGLPTGPFDKNAAALIAEAEKLSKDVAIADNEQAQKIAAKLKVIRDLAKKTKGNQEALTANLDKVISPIEAELKRKASFRGFLQERAAEFRKTLPEKLASKIPLVGGLVGGYLKQRRESKEGLDKYARDLEIGREGGRGRGFGGLGATRASDIPGLGMDESKSTLGGIHEEVKKIRELIENKFAPESDSSELSKRESELEGMAKGIPGDKLKPAGEKKSGLIGSLLGKLKSIIEGIGSSLMSLLSSISSTILDKAKTLIQPAWDAIKNAGSKILEKAKELAKPAWEATKEVAGKTWETTKNVAGRAWEATKSVAGKTWDATKSVAGKTWDATKSVAGKTWDATKSVGGKALEATKSVASSVAEKGGGMLSKAGGWLSKGWSAVSETASKLNPVKTLGSAVKSGAGKIIKGIVSIPGLGAAISAGLAIKDIMDIKGNPELSAEQKKDQIGRSVVGALGSGIGSLIGGVAGSALIPIPGLGTIVGTLGGMWVGEKLAELLADAVGGKGIYDMVASIPGIGSLVSVEDTPKPPETAGAEGQLDDATESAVAGQTTATEVEGTISAPSTPNTSVGRMVGEYSAQKEALGDAQAAAAGGGGKVVNNSSVETRVNNTTNNFNDDIRIRNNDPTLKTMQMAAHSF